MSDSDSDSDKSSKRRLFWGILGAIIATIPHARSLSEK